MTDQDSITFLQKCTWQNTIRRQHTPKLSHPSGRAFLLKVHEDRVHFIASPHSHACIPPLYLSFALEQLLRFAWWLKMGRGGRCFDCPAQSSDPKASHSHSLSPTPAPLTAVNPSCPFLWSSLGILSHWARRELSGQQMYAYIVVNAKRFSLLNASTLVPHTAERLAGA